MKKLLALLLTLVMAVSVVAVAPTVSAQETVYTSGDFQYVKLNDKNIRITKYIGEDFEVVIPKKIDNLTVTETGAEILPSHNDVVSITFPDTITKMNKYTFDYANKVEKVHLSNGITELPYLYNCRRLYSLTIPPKVKSIGFSDLPIYTGTLILGKGVQELNEGRRESEIFTAQYINLEKIKVSRNNKYFSSKDGILYNKNKTKIIACPQKNPIYKFTVPKSVKIIGKLAFYKQDNLERITFSKNVKTIEFSAFEKCKMLEIINIPKNITKIGGWAFSDCQYVEKLKIDANKNLKIYNCAFSGLTFLDTLKVPNVSGNYVFEYCNTLDNITIPKDVKRIRRGQFYHCWGLMKVTIPKTVKKIEPYAFGYYCYEVGQYDYKPKKIKGFTIRGYKGSAGEKYAKKNGFKFVKIG